MGGAELPKKFEYDGKSFKSLILGKQKQNNREWILAMGSHPAKIINGRVTNVHKFRDTLTTFVKYDYIKQHLMFQSLDKWRIENNVPELFA